MRSMLLILTVIASTARAQDEQTFTSPTEAAKHADFGIQGEYVGPVRAMQVIALGNGDFEAVVYAGGLPGAGWDSSQPQRLDVDAEGVAKLVQSNNMQRVERKSPTLGMKPPEGAIVLFDGTQASLDKHWQKGAKLDDGLLEAGATSIDTFDDYSLHVEFRTPFKPKARGQARGNSGVYYQGRYETQVLDSFGLEGKMNEAGGIYSIRDPDLNMCLPPLTWQTYDADFTAAKFDAAGKKTADATLTVRLNGVIVQQNIALPHKTTAAPVNEGPEPGPVFLQGHGNPVRFRNIWAVRRDSAKEARRPIVPGYERMLTSNSGQGLEGIVLLGELGCTNCHQSPSGLVAPKPAPILDNAGSRIRPDYMLEFISAPHTANPGTAMPDLLSQLPASDRRQAAQALASFLMSTDTIIDRRGHPKAAARGKEIFHSIGCTACHSSQEADAKPLAISVSLTRDTLDSLTHFLQHPHEVRPGMRMPMLVKGQDAADVATYLLRNVIIGESIHNMKVAFYKGNWDKLPNFGELKPVKEFKTYGLDIGAYNKKLDRFGAVFECFLHAPADQQTTFHLSSDDGARILIDGKVVVDNDGVHPMGWRSNSLSLSAGAHQVRIEYFEKEGGEGLEVEIEWDGQRRMPLETLATLEESDRPAKPLIQSEFEAKPELFEQGANLFASSGCAACHPLNGSHGRIDSTRKATNLESLKSSGGCLAESVPVGLPNYELNSQQRSSLSTTIEALQATPSKLNDTQFVHSTMAAMNCYACHSRGGVGGPDAASNASFKSTIQEMGDEGRLPPRLDGVGDKLQEKYIRTILQDGADERSYMQVSMPGFGQGTLDGFASALSRIDLRSDATIARADDSIDQTKAAGRLLAGTKGLSCIQCHTAGGKGTGLRAIDMQHMTTRLREDWFHRYLMVPTLYRPGTRMPSSFPDGKSVLPQLYDGQPSKQIDALWQYLSDGAAAKIPIGAEATMIELAPTERPVIYRNFLAGLSPRGIAVGYPSGGNVAWDANAMSLTQIWRGSFIDASKHWVGRGPGTQTPLGDQILIFEEYAPVAKLESIDAPWPAATARERGYRFLGYRLDELGQPTFRYQFGDTHVSDTPSPIKDEKLGVILQRTLSLSGTAQGIVILLARGEKIEPRDSRYYVDDRYSVQVDEKLGTKPQIVASGELFELRLPVDLTSGTASIVETIRW